MVHLAAQNIGNTEDTLRAWWAVTAPTIELGAPAVTALVAVALTGHAVFLVWWRRRQMPRPPARDQLREPRRHRPRDGEPR